MSSVFRLTQAQHRQAIQEYLEKHIFRAYTKIGDIHTLHPKWTDSRYVGGVEFNISEKCTTDEDLRRQYQALQARGFNEDSAADYARERQDPFEDAAGKVPLNGYSRTLGGVLNNGGAINKAPGWAGMQIRGGANLYADENLHQDGK